ncbi:M1 family metallopeptidase [Candidatus Saccharibacteria bacterium]|nr:M1 family metallopeptidase [Candidatus Saccharibacteria bacterium]
MKKVTRLFEQFNPHHYILDITPDIEKLQFSGSVIISGKKTGKPSKRITLHQKELKIASVHIIKHDKSGDSEIKITRQNVHRSFDELRIHTAEMLYPGNYTISVSFSGEITKAMNGIYPCFYQENNIEKRIIATQFESHHAREVFPCIDEPEAKATFELSLVHKPDLTVISNTNIDKQEKIHDNKHFVRSSFKRTPLMSTYLLAFIYGDLEYKQAKTKAGVVIRTYATPDKVKFADFALDVAVKCLDYYNQYFDIPYPLEKCDMIALPDFASGAMENWGCITYREHGVLVDPKNTSLDSRQYVAMVVAHELTHQWFGNLVTMRWWTDLWLNEGFASWFEYLALDHIFPEWKMWTQFAVDDQQQAFRADALEHTHPVEVEVKHPDEIRTIFDSISYHKGASVIHMLYHYLGAPDFQKGLQYYLLKHSYKNTDTTDLWEALEEVSGKPVAKFMNAWTSTEGYPVVKADITNKKVQLSQQRFVLNPTHKTKSGNWPIPMLTNAKNQPDIFDKQKMQLTGQDFSGFRLNADSSGFYRTIYNASHLQTLASQIKSGHFSPLSRLSLLADISECAKAGLIETTEVLQFMKAYVNEEDNAVWDIMAGVIGGIRSLIADDQLREDMKPYIRQLVSKELGRLGLEKNPKDSYFDQLLRPTIVGLAALADEPEVVNYLLGKFDNTKPKELTIEIDPDLRSAVFSAVARRGKSSDFDKLVKMHNKSSFSEERLNLCMAICSFKDTKLIDKALNMIVSPEVRLQDVSYWIAYCFSNRNGHDLTWEWLKTNWEWLKTNLGADLAFYRMPIYSARGVSDESFAKEYKKFFSSKLSASFDRPYKQGHEMIEWQSAWKARDFKTVKHYFSVQNKQ